MVMILALLTNIGALAATDATDNDGKTQNVKIIKWMEVGFTGVYALELLVHGVAYGFDTYKHPMRAVDLAIVVVNGGLLAAFLLGAKTNVVAAGAAVWVPRAAAVSSRRRTSLPSDCSSCR